MTPYDHYQHLLFERADHGILKITINRPEVLNATNSRLHWELAHVWSISGTTRKPASP